jgi:cation diffusion facilitator CzcD-associated flavoprotein CzcO
VFRLLLTCFPAFGAKRLIYENGYFEALNKPNVKAVTGRIASFRPNAVVLDDGREMSADYVVLATGYNAESVDVDVVGTEDRTKNYKSKADWAQYHGVSRVFAADG